MAKKQRGPTHTYDELLKLAVGKCIETGGMPSRRSWTHDNFINFDELRQVLGGGDWNRAEKVIREAYQGELEPEKPKSNTKGELAKTQTERGEEMKGSNLVKYQSYTAEEWLDWLYLNGGGKLLREESFSNNRREQYDLIMEVFGNWESVQKAFAAYKQSRVAAEAKEAKNEELPSVKEMLKQVPVADSKAPAHTPDELLELAVQECVKQGKMPADFRWMSSATLDFEDLVKVLGEGSWDSARWKIERAWKKYEEEQERSEKEAPEEVKATEVGEPVVEDESTFAAEEESAQPEEKKIRRAPRKWSKEECVEFLQTVYDKLGKLPNQIELNRWIAELSGPSYAVILNRLGKKDGWEALLKRPDTDETQRETEESKAEETQVMPEPELAEPEVEDEDEDEIEKEDEPGIETEVVTAHEEQTAVEPEKVQEIAVVLHAAEIDLTVNGTRTRIHVEFKPAKEE